MENHLLRLHSYLMDNLPGRKEANIIRTELLTKYRCRLRDQCKKSFKRTKMCMRCFSSWAEGNFSIKFETEKSKKKKEKKLAKCIIKCFNCTKSTSFAYGKSDPVMRYKKPKSKKRFADSKVNVSSKRKKTSASDPKPGIPIKRNITSPADSHIPTKRKEICPPIRQKKSSLTLLNEIL